MMQRSDVIGKIRIDFFFIKQHVAQLTSLVSDQVTHCSVFSLPKLTKEDIGLDHPQISITPCCDKQAIEKYVEHLLDFTLANAHPGVMAKRLPGYIVIQTQHEKEIVERINIINRLKKEFDLFIQQYAGRNTDERFDTVSAAVPNMIRKAVARKILVAPEETFSVSFSWSHSTSRGKPHKKSFWEKKLERTLIAKRHEFSDKDWNKTVAIEKRALMNANKNQYFRVVRPLRVNPIINVKYSRDEITGTFEKTTMIAHSPLLVINQNPKIFDIKPYNGKRLATPQTPPIIERLHLYPYDISEKDDIKGKD